MELRHHQLEKKLRRGFWLSVDFPTTTTTTTTTTTDLTGQENYEAIFRDAIVIDFFFHGNEEKMR